MTDEQAIDEVVRRTGVERFRSLCSEANTLPPPNSRADYLRHVRELARPPTAAEQAANLGRSLFAWATSGFAMTTDDERSARLSVCAGCEHWDAAPRRCRLCGCYTDAKIALKTEHCPINKW